jgi:hypothetical protein
MKKIITYGIGGYCENCDLSHDHPLNNLISIIEVEDALPEEPATDVQALADALAQLPQETLDALKQALGIGENNG